MMAMDSDTEMDAFIVSDSEGSDYADDTNKKESAGKAKSTAKRKPAVRPKANGASKKPKTQPADSHGEMTATQSRPDGRTIEDIYQKKTQLEHILLRPDTYIGSVEALEQQLWVYDSANGRMVQRSITIVPGFYKIIDEILVNAADNKIRDPSMDTLKVTIDREKNEISVYNNGQGIPIEMHKDEKVHVPELIFGHLLTSSNYNDAEKKVTGGRNGYGAKLCNIFSTEFIVETADRVHKYRQRFSDNMSVIEPPRISANPKKEQFTKITFKPDLQKFGMECMDEDIVSLLNKRVYDMAGTVLNVKVYLNGERLKIKDFKQYIELYTKGGDDETKPKIIHQVIGPRWEVAFTVSDGQFQQVSFVNGICTVKGGTHVNYVADQIVAKLIEAVKKKNKSAPVKPFQVKNHMWVFVNCLIENPTFDSQTKENMTLRASAFGSKCDMPDDFIKKIFKSGVIENILTWVQFKQDQQLKKTDGQRRSRVSGISKLDDANDAGTRKSGDCTLILTEGDSAKTLAISGMTVVGRDKYGVFPLRGKLLNVRDASHTQIMNNVEINHVKQILGLQHGKKYESIEGLRYGKLMIMTDQDHDGSHIKGLIINFLDHFFPSLLRIPGFLVEFITPIVKVTKGRTEKSFFTIPEYESWKSANDDGKGWKIKYYKGLGTSTPDDAKKYFRKMDEHRKTFKPIVDDERTLVDMAFNKKRADDRKEWLKNFQPGTFLNLNVEQIPISDFVNKELILFSMADNTRSIPSMVDGFKPGQRKVLYGCFKRNLKGEIKVAQLGGYVAEHSAYHHGEQSLTATIIGMAQNFVGNNNINVLDPRGQFGTRIHGGKDAASARYIFTTLAPITRSIFHSDDDQLLRYLNDDGQMIEPEWYIPVLPMILVNGSEGIGTGWSSFIPNYNPHDLVRNIRNLFQGLPLEPMHPWYRGFKGTIEKVDDRYRSSGTIRKLNDTTLEITELPIRSWTQAFKDMLDQWCANSDKSTQCIKDYRAYHTEASVHFEVTMTPEMMRKAEDEGLEKMFKLGSTISINNMVCFDKDNRLRRYSSPEEILREFYDLRLVYYERRKIRLENNISEQLSRLSNRVRFITEIIDGSLVVQRRKRDHVLADLQKRGYVPFPKKESRSGEQAEDDGETSGDTGDADGDTDEQSLPRTSASDHGYDYLLSMPIWSFTEEKIKQLTKEHDSKQFELDILRSKTPKDLWNEDLDLFLEKWETFTTKMSDSERAVGATKSRGKGKRASAADASDDDYLTKPAKKKAVATPRKKVAKAVTAVVAKDKPAPVFRQQSLLDSIEQSADSRPTSADTAMAAAPVEAPTPVATIDRLSQFLKAHREATGSSAAGSRKVTVNQAAKKAVVQSTDTEEIHAINTTTHVDPLLAKRATQRRAPVRKPRYVISDEEGSGDDNDAGVASDNDDAFVVGDSDDDFA